MEDEVPVEQDVHLERKVIMLEQVMVEVGVPSEKHISLEQEMSGDQMEPLPQVQVHQ